MRLFNRAHVSDSGRNNYGRGLAFYRQNFLWVNLKAFNISKNKRIEPYFSSHVLSKLVTTSSFA